MAVDGQKLAVITGKTKLAEQIVSIWMKQEAIAATAKAGQFVMLYCADGSRLLPRPISICQICAEEGLLRVVFRVAGAGTKELAALSVGAQVLLLGPLGNGFLPEDWQTRPNGRYLLIGGGIGIPPLLALAQRLAMVGSEVAAVLGFRDCTCFLAEEFAPYARVYLATEDGSVGCKGTVIDAILAAREGRQAEGGAMATAMEAQGCGFLESGAAPSLVFSCGPLPMLRGVAALAEQLSVRARLSMEERMACGVGACLACVVKTREIDSHTNVKNKRVCKDGPVFWADEIEL